MKEEEKNNKKQQNPENLSFTDQVASVWHIMRWLSTEYHEMQLPVLAIVQKDTNIQMER